MKLEDCTKDELIYLLNRRCWSYISSTSEIEFDVLMYRSEETNKAMGREAEKEAEALAEYTELLKPYVGERLVDIPENIIKKASKAIDRNRKHRVAYASLQKKYDKIQKQIDENLNKKGESENG